MKMPARTKSLRDDALRMVHDWVIAVEALQSGRGHPMELIRQLHLQEKTEARGVRDGKVTARGVATRSRKRGSAADLRALAGEPRQTDRILRMVESIDPRYREALVVRVQTASAAQAATVMRRSGADFARFYEGGMASFCTCLALNFGAV